MRNLAMLVICCTYQMIICALSGTMQVFINGMAYEVPSTSALDVAGTFGRDAILVHSSGEILPVNENGVLMKSMQMGECYYLVIVNPLASLY
jgi:hypothetical protein